ncbi:lamin tail domain-containing protein [Candidatus Curtissbacteria bacterium]|nr:lamin tail domain-containing protein [Candidatus Curtissbacteria bacterium]
MPNFLTALIVLSSLLFVVVPPTFANVSIVINEIMYDLDGSDSDREWIEIVNIGSDSVDLTSWRFEEAGTQHTLVLKQGSAQLASGQYALIVDNYDKFLQDNPGFSGTVFDSSFSLSNTGENLKLRDAQNGNVINEVTYSSDWGAAGDGYSLQRKPDNSWIAAAPTGGSTNATEPAPSLQPSPTSSSSQSNTISSSSKTTKSPSSPTPKSQSAILGEKSSDQEASSSLLSSLENSPSPQPSPSGQSSSRTKIAALLVGSGAVLIGLALGSYFWFRRILAKSPPQEEGQNNSED